MSGFYHARSYVEHDRCPWANNHSIFQYFVETMVISFVNLTQEHSWEIFEIQNYDQWSVPNHKIFFFFHSYFKSKKKKIRMHHKGRRNFSQWLCGMHSGQPGLRCFCISIFSGKPSLHPPCPSAWIQSCACQAPIERPSSEITNDISDCGLLTTSPVLLQKPI